MCYDFYSKKDNFYFLDRETFKDIIPESTRIDEYVRYINNEKIKELTIMTPYYTDDNIDFILNCPNVEIVTIVTSRVKSLEPLYSLPKLKELILSVYKYGADLEKMKKLKSVSLSSTKKILGLNKCASLKNLYLYSYCPDEKDLSLLQDLKTLERITIVRGNITSLKGLPADNLKFIEMSYLPKLADISDVSLAQNCVELEFTNCPHIEDYTPIAEMNKLFWLRISRCAPIPNLSFIEKMSSLKNMSFVETNVIDGNLYPCERLDFAGFDNKRHYTHRFIDVGFRISRKR